MDATLKDWIPLARPSCTANTPIGQVTMYSRPFASICAPLKIPPGHIKLESNTTGRVPAFISACWQYPLNKSIFECRVFKSH